MDLPLGPVDDEKADPTWDADGSHWSTSSDDEEESVTAFDDLPRVSGTGSIAKATHVQVELSNRPHLALFNKAAGAPKMETRGTIKNEPLEPARAQSSDSDDSSLASIPAIARLKETPVPLPPTVAAAGSLPASVSSQPRLAGVPSTTPRAPPAPRASGPASTPTPVPLPSTVMQNAYAPQVFGQTPSRSAPATTLPDSRKPAATSSTPSSGLGESLPLPFTNEKIEPTLPHGAHSTATPRKRYPVPMETAADGRPYTIFIQPNGKPVPTKGVLIPAGYKLHSDPQLPFICPVRGCQSRRFKNLAALSGHFGSCHSNMTFNDNGDGSISKFGNYRNPSGRSPGIVVAQVPFPRATHPALKRGLGEDGAGPSKRQLEESDAGQDRKRRAMSEDREHNQTTQFERDVSKYMAAVHSGFRTANRRDISRMLALPRKRDLPKEFLDKHTYTDLAAQTYACAVAYVVGDEVSGRSACHAATGPLACLSKQCIVLPKSIQLDPKIVRIFTPHHRCVGCAYLALMTSAPDQCELRTEPSKAGSGDKVIPTSSGRPLPDVPILRSSQPAPQQEPQSSPMPSGQGTEQTLSRRPVRQSVLNRLQMDKDRAARPKSKSPTEQPGTQVNRPQTDKNQTARSQSKSPSEQPSAQLNRLQADMDQATQPQILPTEQPGTQLNHTDKDQVARSQSKSPTEQHSSTRLERGILPIKHHGQFGTPEYEMEDWEIAPGRVTNEDSSRNIAYSGAFLTSSTPITISHDIDFNILTIRPGQIYNVPVQKGKIQVFSVASGKLKVTTGGKVVQLGPNGVFPVRPGEKCVIENRIYFEAVVHCTTVKDYELA
ncbi:Cupin, RmlC-type [Metarhizium guizhouense ARSEF 977]|uniref:Cupin, RmlC-type n=1 Tax=Metarhizium guizhouense (strain ARSEF 977) TaxID=1276136 RepID=A0A0B4H147_METGA|nr:Cupin, RmlC-type [Metarhizium guizhouense ARSEF 977]